MERTSQHKLSCAEQPPQQRRATPDAVLSSALFHTETKLAPTPSSNLTSQQPQTQKQKPALTTIDSVDQAALEAVSHYSSHRMLRDPKLSGAPLSAKPTNSLASLGKKSSNWLRSLSGRMFRAAAQAQAPPTPANLTELYLAAGRQVLTPEQREAKATADATAAAAAQASAAAPKASVAAPKPQQLAVDSPASSLSGRSDMTEVDLCRPTASAAAEQPERWQQQQPAQAGPESFKLDNAASMSFEADAGPFGSSIMMDTAPEIIIPPAPSSPPNAFAAASGPPPSPAFLAGPQERSTEFKSEFERWSDRPRGRRRALDVDRQSMSDGAFWAGAGELGAALGVRGLSMGTFAEDPAKQFEWQRRRATGLDQMYQQAFLPDNLEAKANMFNIAVEESVYNRAETAPVRYSMQHVRS